MGDYSFTLGSLSAGSNYNLSIAAAPKFSITGKTLVGLFTASDKVYDGNTDASVTSRSLTGVEGSDDVRLDGGTAAFSDKNTGTGKTVTLTGATLTGAKSGNYVLSGVNTTTATITAKGLTVTGAVAQNKTYDGNTSAQITGATLVGKVGSELVELAGHTTGTFSQANVGTDIAVSTSMSLTGTDKDNYSLAQPSGLKADITGKTLTVINAVVASKVYDGNTNATISGATLSGVLAGDEGDVSLANQSSGTFASSNVGAHSVNTAPMTLTGTKAPNYTLAQPVLSGTITVATVTVTAQADSKVYDGGESSSVSPLVSGVIAPDAVATEPVQVFDTKGVGSGKTLTASGLVINDGNSGNNYTINYVANTTGVITAKSILITADAGQSKIYGSADPAFTYTSSPALISGDNFSGSISRAAGEDVGDYSFTLGTLTAGANYSLSVAETPKYKIEPRSITIIANTGQTKEYGSSDPFSFTYTVTGTLAFADQFDGALSRVSGEIVGSYAIIQGGLTIVDDSSNNKYSNYTVVYVSNDFVITQKPASVTPEIASKTYGETDPLLTGTLSGFLPVDNVTATYSRTVGESVGPYTISAILSPADVLSNYVITYNTATFTINHRPIEVVVQDPSSLTRTFKVGLTFSEPVTGVDASNIQVENGNLDQISGSGANYELYISVNQTGDIVIRLGTGIRDLATGTNNFAGLVLTYSFSNDGSPKLSNWSPTGIGAVTDNHPEFVMTFDKELKIGTNGSLRVYLAGTSTEILNIPITASMIQNRTVVATYQTEFGLDKNTDYYVLLDAGIVTDLSGNSFGGLSNSNTWTFRTGNDFKTSSSDILTAINFKIYPNPFIDRLYIENAKYLSRIVISMNGQIIKEVRKPSEEIQLNELKAGIYLLSLFNLNGEVISTVKVIKVLY